MHNRHSRATLLFSISLVAAWLAIALPSCKKSTESNNEKPQVHTKSTRTKGMTRSLQKRPRPGSAAARKERIKQRLNRKKGNSILYVRLRFADLLAIPFVQEKRENLKALAMKKGYLGTLLRCGLDFTSKLEVVAILVPQDFKTSKKGALTLKGSFDGGTLARCIAKDLKWSVMSDKIGKLEMSADKLRLSVDYSKSGVLAFKSPDWKWVPHDKAPAAFRGLSSGGKLPAVMMGSINPSIPWKNPPSSILLGMTPLLTGLSSRAIINFADDKGAAAFDALLKQKILDMITSATKAGSDPPHVVLLKKLGVKRVANRILATVNARWDEVVAVVKQVTVKVKVKP